MYGPRPRCLTGKSERDVRDGRPEESEEDEDDCEHNAVHNLDGDEVAVGNRLSGFDMILFGPQLCLGLYVCCLHAASFLIRVPDELPGALIVSY